MSKISYNAMIRSQSLIDYLVSLKLCPFCKADLKNRAEGEMCFQCHASESEMLEVVND